MPSPTFVHRRSDSSLFTRLSYYFAWFCASFYRVYKFILHFTTNSTQIDRICRSYQLQTNLPLTIFTSSPRRNKLDRAKYENSTFVLNLLKCLSRSNVLFRLSIIDQFIDPPSITSHLPVTLSSTTSLIEHQLESLKTIRLTDASYLSSLLISAKKINHNWTPIITKAFSHVLSLSDLLFYVELLRTTSYDPQNDQHQQLMNLLWTNFIKNTPMPPLQQHKHENVRGEDEKEPCWTWLGFQGCNASTDFRGMGMFGLHQLISFSIRHPNQSQRIFAGCRDADVRLNRTNSFFSFAITAINLSSDLLSFLFDENCPHFRPQTGFQNHKLAPSCTSMARVLYENGEKLEILDDCFARLFVQFYDFWSIENPVNVMEYNRIHKAFITKINKDLKSNRFEPLECELSDEEFINNSAYNLLFKPLNLMYSPYTSKNRNINVMT